MKIVSQNTTALSSATAPGNNQPQLVATPVPDEQRISFWPQHFGLIPQWVTLEPRVFGWMDRLCEDYCGGIWNLYTLNNGGAFMAPEPDDDDDETWVLFNVMNGNRAEMSPEAAVLNSHDGTSSYQMLPGYFRFVCQNGCVCGQSLGEVRVPHRGNVVEKVIEGAYEVVGVFDRIEEKRDAMQSLVLPPPARQALAQAALTYRYGDEHQPVTTADILTPRRREDYGKDLWSAYQTIQENMLKGGISGRSARGKRIHTRAIHSIDTDIKLNRALWVMAETLLESLR